MRFSNDALVASAVQDEISSSPMKRFWWTRADGRLGGRIGSANESSGWMYGVGLWAARVSESSG